MATKIKTVSISNLEMDYFTFGSGEKKFIILPGLSIHSVMNAADAIAEAYQIFASDYTVYVFDRVKNIHIGYTIKDMAEDTAAAMNALHIESADLFGASQGGMIGQYLAIDHPELVHKLILGSTLAKPNDVFLSTVAEWCQLAEEKNELKLLEHFADCVYSESTLNAYRDIIISTNRGISDHEFKRFLIMTEACKTFDCYDALSSIQCPVLVLGSDGDRVVTSEGSKQIAKVLGCALYLYDSNYGHGVYDEAPDYKQRCLEFLEND
jgi:3-oxoadipate enol-lactonase